MRWKLLYSRDPLAFSERYRSELSAPLEESNRRNPVHRKNASGGIKKFQNIRLILSCTDKIERHILSRFFVEKFRPVSGGDPGRIVSDSESVWPHCWHRLLGCSSQRIRSLKLFELSRLAERNSEDTSTLTY